MASKIYIDPERFIAEIKKRPEIWKSSHNNYRNKFRKTSAWFEICEAFDPNFYERSEVERNEWYSRCTNRWRNMRDHYLKAQKRRSQPKLWGTTPKSYVFEQHLSFLHAEYKLKHKEIAGDENIETNENEESPHSTSSAEKDVVGDKKKAPEPIFKRKLPTNDLQKSKRKLEVELIDDSDTEYNKEEPQPSTSGIKKPKRLIEPRNKKEIEVINIPSTPPPRPLNEIDDDQAFFDSFLPIIKTFNIDQKLEMRSQFLNMIRSIRSQSLVPKVEATVEESPSSPEDSQSSPMTPLRFTPDPLMSPPSPDIKSEL